MEFYFYRPVTAFRKEKNDDDDDKEEEAVVVIEIVEKKESEWDVTFKSNWMSVWNAHTHANRTFVEMTVHSVHSTKRISMEQPFDRWWLRFLCVCFLLYVRDLPMYARVCMRVCVRVCLCLCLAISFSACWCMFIFEKKKEEKNEIQMSFCTHGVRCIKAKTRTNHNDISSHCSMRSHWRYNYEKFREKKKLLLLSKANKILEFNLFFIFISILLMNCHAIKSEVCFQTTPQKKLFAWSVGMAGPCKIIRLKTGLSRIIHSNWMYHHYERWIHHERQCHFRMVLLL